MFLKIEDSQKMKGTTKGWLKRRKIFSKRLKLSGNFSKLPKKKRKSLRKRRFSKCSKTEDWFVEITWGSSSWLRLLRLFFVFSSSALLTEIFLAIFEAIFFHIWRVLEPRKESESSTSLLVREILFFWHFYFFKFDSRWLIIFQIRGVLEAHKQRSRNRQQQRPCPCSSSFLFSLATFLWWFLPNRRSFWGKKLVRSHNHQSGSFLEQFF